MTSWAKRHGTTGGRLVIDWESLHARFRDDVRTAEARRQAAEEISADRVSADRGRENGFNGLAAPAP